jgi:hypothetical protein
MNSGWGYVNVWLTTGPVEVPAGDWLSGTESFYVAGRMRIRTTFPVGGLPTKADRNEPGERSFGDMYKRQEEILGRTETPERNALSENLLRVAGFLQITAALIAVISIGDLSIVVIFANIFLIILCIVIFVLGVLVVVKQSVGEAYGAGLLGIFVGGPYLASTILSLISLAVVLFNERL